MHCKGQITPLRLKPLENVAHFYLSATSWASRRSLGSSRAGEWEPAKTSAAAGYAHASTLEDLSCCWQLHSTSLQPSLSWIILQTPTEATTTIWAKTMHTRMSSRYLEVLFWNLLVCRGMNENAYVFSVLKSTGCISTCNFCTCKRVCACIQLRKCMGILNLEHPVHIIGSLNFKKQTEVIKMLLRRSFSGQCVLSPTQNSCLLPPSDQVSHDFV